jgi:hypothetical protein
MSTNLTQDEEHMNPLHWRRGYQVAWIAICIVSGLTGLFFAWTDSTAHIVARSQGNTSHWFFLWLSHPSGYWQWPLFGFVFVGLIFWAAMLVREIADDMRSAASAVGDLASLRIALRDIAAECNDERAAKELRKLLGE